MGEKRRCDGCGKEYWWPSCRWQHEKCGKGKAVGGEIKRGGDVGVSGKGVCQAGVVEDRTEGDGRVKFDKVAYQRGYMRRRRERLRNEVKES